MFDFFKRKPAPESPPPQPPEPTAPASAAQPPVEPAPPTEEAARPAEPEATQPARRSWAERLKSGLAASREKLGGALVSVFRNRILDEQALDDLEDALLTADVGIDATRHLLEDLKERYRVSASGTDPRELLRAALYDLIRPLEQPLRLDAGRPFVMMVAGVNGAGKTTSIGKLAKWFQQQGLTVLLSAGDTFRAAAREQLAIWGARNGVAVIAQEGGDAAAVTFDAVGAAKARGVDVVIADTAGRLPTQLHLMDELKKVKRVIAKAQPDAPHEVLLVLDANTGQNAVTQVKAFDAAIGVTGLVVTKLDGSAKGGVVAAIAKQQPIPIRFIGVGEGLEDLRPFTAREFVDALLPPA